MPAWDPARPPPPRPAPAATDFDTGFMVLAEDDRAPLAITWGNSTEVSVGPTSIWVQDLTFFSERLDNVDIRISAAIARPIVGLPSPGIVLVHGYGGTHESMMPVARELAAA